MPVGERKSGMPLSVETPAPVSTTHGWRSRMSSARRSALTPAIVRSDGGLQLPDRDRGPLRGDRRAGRRAQRRLPRVVRGCAHRLPRPLRQAATGASGSRATRRSRSSRTSATSSRFASTTRSSIHARCGDIRGARFRYEYAVTRDGELVADGWTRHAVVDAKTLRPARFPAWLAEAVAERSPRAQVPGPGSTGGPASTARLTGGRSLLAGRRLLFHLRLRLAASASCRRGRSSSRRGRTSTRRPRAAACRPRRRRAW